MSPAVAQAHLALLRAEGGERRDAGADAPHRRALPEYARVSGARRMALHPRHEGARIGCRRTGRLMRLMGLQATYRAPRTSAPHPEHRVYPYLLLGLAIGRPNHVWCADIYIPVQRGFLYLVAVMDWASRYVLTWRLSNTLDASFCTDTLDEALGRYGTPEIFNTDQGSQFTSFAFTGRLQAPGIRISMDGEGPVPGHHLHRAAVALAQIRGDLAARDRRRPYCPAPDPRMDSLLQCREAAAALDGRPPAEAYRGETPAGMMDKPLRTLPTSS